MQFSLSDFSIKTQEWQDLCQTLKPEDAFVECFLFVIAMAYEKISTTIHSLDTIAPIITENALKNIIFNHMVQDIAPLITRSCVYELHEAKQNGYLTADTKEARFEQFIIELIKSENIQAFLQKYPVLQTLLFQYLRQFTQFMNNFFMSFDAEYFKIMDYFSLTKNNSLVYIQKAGDRHRQSQSVLILEFFDSKRKTHQKIVYKPHSLSSDLAYNYFIDWINEQENFGLRYPKTLDCIHHGWCEFIECKPCESAEQVTQFYYRLGNLLAITYLLNGGDLHYENLLASGDCPIIIDHECLIQPVLHYNHIQSIQRLRRTVLDTLILPNRVSVEGEKISFDVSAFGGQEEQFYPEETLRIKYAKTDEMCVERQRTSFSMKNNLPQLNGQFIDPSQYHEIFLNGFTQSYQLLLNNKLILQSESSPLNQFNKVETRVLFKPTVEYFRLLLESFHPKLLHSKKAFHKHLSWVKKERENHKDLDYTLIVQSEIDDLYALDIPLFVHMSDESVVRNSKNQTVGTIVLLNSLEALKKQVDCLCDNDFFIQKNIVQQTLFASTYKKNSNNKLLYTQQLSFPQAKNQSEHRTVQLVYEDANETFNAAENLSAQCLDKSREILDYMHSLAFIDNEIPYWSYLAPTSDTYWAVNLTSFDLYNGLLGIILTYAHAYQLTKKPHYYNMVKKFTDRLELILKTLNPKCSIGAYSGLGAFIYTLHQLRQLDFISVSDCYSLLQKITTHFDQNFELDYPGFDVIDGTAGYLISLISARDCLDKNIFSKQSRQCIEHLMRLYPNPKKMPKHTGNQLYKNKTILGFAHGMMGVAYALWHYAKISGDDSVMPWIEKALTLHQSTWNAELKNWPDAYSNKSDDLKEYSSSWCYGRVGQSLLYLSLLESDKCEWAKPFVEACIESVRDEKLLDITNFCHGDMGSMDFLLMAESSGYAKSQVEKLILPSLVKLDKIQTDHVGHVFIPGVMTGLSGVAYQCMRLVAPNQVPSILSLGLI